MEEALDKFESMVGSAEEKLNDIEKKIDAEFSGHLNSDEEDGGDDKDSLLQKLEEIKTEYSTVCQEAAEVSAAQREMAKVFQQELLKQVKQLQALQDRGFSETNGKLDQETESAINSLVEQSEVAENLTNKLNKKT